MNKKIIYDQKYKNSGLVPSKYFKQQFKYIQQKYIDKSHLKILDLGGGTGEYSLLLQALGHTVTLFDFSEQAVIRAKNIGVKQIICDDFLTYDFQENRYDVVFVKGFSLLNTDDKVMFQNLMLKMNSILNDDGYIIYMGQTDLSSKWTDSGWYQLGEILIEESFDSYLIMPAFRYQIKLPLIINLLITKLLIFLSPLRRSMTLVGICKCKK